MARSTTVRSSAGFGRARFALGDDSGFTLAEAIVAFGLFIVISVSATYALIKVIQLSNVNQDRVAAANLATKELEKLRIQNNGGPNQLDSTPQTVSLHGTTFTVTPTLMPAATATCDTGSSRRVSVVVTWQSNPQRSARYDSVLSC